MKTIQIGAQESAESLANAFASALANAIGWTVDSTTVRKNGIPLCFLFSVSGSSVYLRLSNGRTSVTAMNGRADFGASKTYKLFVVRSAGGTIAVGIADSTGNTQFPLVLAQNTAGEYAGISIHPNNNLYVLHKNDNAYNSMYTASVLKDNSICTSISKLIDVWGVAMFKDLYAVFSCPYINSEAVYTIAGKNYRMANYDGGSSHSYSTLAIPEV